MFIKKSLFVLSLFFSSFYLSAQQIPLEHLASLPDVNNVILSPNGRYIASLVKVNTKTHQGTTVNLYDVEKNTRKNLVFSDNQKYVITSILWPNNKSILVKAKFPAARYGTPTTETRLLNLNIATGQMNPVIPRTLINRMVYMPNIMSDIVDLLPDDEDHILMSLSGFVRNSSSVSIVKVNIYGGGVAKFVERAKKDVIDWVIDSKHRPRIATRLDDTHYEILEKDPETKEVRVLWSFEAFSKEQVWPRGFGADENVLYVQAIHQDKNAIFKVNLKNPKLTKKLVYFDEHYDVTGGLRISPITKEVIGVGYHYWDEDVKNFVKSLDNALPDTDNLLIGMSDDENNYLVLSSSDIESGMYAYGDRKEKSLTAVAFRYQHLDPQLLSPKEKISYQARDGLTIEGYLTIPKNSTGKNLPTIIHPHGGPISYDDGGFDYWTQYFANKGYAVLQMNFRGSYGYGFNFMQLGIASWGQAMQDDVADGTQWLIEQGIADKNKICIIGASYGGYAAMMGAVKTPDLYQCAISFAGVSDVEYLVDSHRHYTNYKIVEKQIGDDDDLLHDASPVNFTEKIKVPVLLIHGSKDRVVRAKHSEKMLAKLKKHKKVVDYVELDGGDHYLSNNEHRLQTFRAMDKFLDTYLPVN